MDEQTGISEMHNHGGGGQTEIHEQGRTNRKARTRTYAISKTNAVIQAYFGMDLRHFLKNVSPVVKYF